MGAGWVSIELGTKGPLMSECTACAASNMAIGDALDAIRIGRADVMFAGGTEAPVTAVGIAGFDSMRALSRRNDDPAKASRPFDQARDGLVMGEAGAVLVLEELEHAQARGAKIYAELVGYGVSSDAAHMTEPDPTGENPARAMTMAFDDAGVDPSEIGYVNAHATSTPLGDASETRVIKLALGEENARKTPISSTKGATGHCFGAAGAIEAVFTTLAVRDRKLPPTINYERARPELRPRLHPERGARRAGPRRRVSRTRSASAATTRASWSAFRRLSAPTRSVPLSGCGSSTSEDASSRCRCANLRARGCSEPSGGPGSRRSSSSRWGRATERSTRRFERTRRGSRGSSTPSAPACSIRLS